MPSLRGRASRIAAIAALAFALVGLDYRDGPLTQTPSLYIFPIGLAAWFLGEAWGIAFALGLALIRSSIDHFFWRNTLAPALILCNLGIRLFVFLLVAEAVHRHARLNCLRKRRLDLMLEHLPIGVGYTDAQGRILEANPAERAIWAGIRKVGRGGYGEYRGRYPGGNWFVSEQWAVDRALRSGQPVLKEVVEIEAFDGSRKTILNSAVRVTDELDRTVGAIFVNEDVTEDIRRQKEREDLIRQLEEAMAKVKTLKGMLPICASCKKVRDDAGYWKQIEDYVREHADVRFSHGICPDCAARIYPDYLDPEAPGSADSSASAPRSSPAEDD